MIENKPIEKQKNDLEKLKDILFLTLNDLLDGELDCIKANTVSKMAQTIINLEKINNNLLNKHDSKTKTP